MLRAGACLVWALAAAALPQPSRAASPFYPRQPTDEDFAEHVAKLKKEQIPNDRFSVVVQRPFVVIGDESAETVARRAKDTVRWTVEHIKKQYFALDPTSIIDIWLFADKESYDKYTKSIFHDTPTTPYGYYSPQHRALIMNIGTGGGTLVHEIVHPFVAANFPACPAWFNEGLASLYEQSGEIDGKIVGYPNWRLPGLQRAIKAKAVNPFEKLCATTTSEFYGDARGTNYSQARYLCYYLQEQGLLGKYYREFVKNQHDDPTGYKTLQAVLGEKDMDAFLKRWEEYVLKLEQ
ncbi:MAG TPA: hypothetical protein VFE24_10850 [Pirellulales bacterium]|nr:hypothetical protein [Pirellulales bacterium]